MSFKVLASTENMPYEEWLAHRRLGIGGSDASVVCGISCYKSPVELWLDKTGQIPYQEAGEAAYWGTRLESLVREEFTSRTGIEVRRPNQLLQNEEYPFMLANLDGICESSGLCVFEAKTASAYKASEWEDVIPDEYQLQIQHYMAVTGYKGAYIAVLIGGNTFRWKFVERDEELISMLIQLESDFWQHVQDGTPPSLDGSNIIRENLKNQPLSFDFFDVVKSPSGGATVFSVPSLAGEEATKELTGIILDYTTPRVYWDTPDPVEGTPPTCLSQNSIISQDGKACARCPFNDFGSKDGESNAKACKESVLLFLLRQDSIMPLLIRVPVTSKARFLKYATRLIGTLTPINGVVTKITLEKATSKSGKPYALFNFETVSILGPEETVRAKEFSRQFMEYVEAAELEPEFEEAS